MFGRGWVSQYLKYLFGRCWVSQYLKHFWAMSVQSTFGLLLWVMSIFWYICNTDFVKFGFCRFKINTCLNDLSFHNSCNIVQLISVFPIIQISVSVTWDYIILLICVWMMPGFTLFFNTSLGDVMLKILEILLWAMSAFKYTWNTGFGNDWFVRIWNTCLDDDMFHNIWSGPCLI